MGKSQKLHIVAHLSGKFHLNGRSYNIVTIYCTRGHCIFVFQTKRTYVRPPVAIWSETWVCGPLLAGIVALNTVEGVDVAC